MRSIVFPTTPSRNGVLPQPLSIADRQAASARTTSSPRPWRASLLEVSHLRKSFGSLVAVDDLSFDVAPGEIFGLVGPNGAGKSTTMTIIAGTRRPDAGTVTIGRQVASEGKRAAQRMLGVVPQDLAIYSELTARENLEFFGEIYGLGGRELKRQIERVLGQIGLEVQSEQYVRTFSGGMKRRLNFGVALIHEPRLVILDEPTVGIDPQSRSHILDCIRELAADGVGVIYASHYMQEVEALCQRVAVIDHGKLLALGTLDELVDKSNGDLHVRVGAPRADLERRLMGLAEVVALDSRESRVVIRREPHAAGATTRRLSKVADLLVAAGIDILSVETRQQNLESLFLEMTGRTLRD